MEVLLLFLTAVTLISYIVILRVEIYKLKKDLNDCKEAFKDLLEKYSVNLSDDDLEGWND